MYNEKLNKLRENGVRNAMNRLFVAGNKRVNDIKTKDVELMFFFVTAALNNRLPEAFTKTKNMFCIPYLIKGCQDALELNGINR